MEQPEGEASGSTDEARTPSPPPPPSPAVSAATLGSMHASLTSRSPTQLLPPKKRAWSAAIAGDDTELLERDAAVSTEAGAGPRSPTPPPSPAPRSTSPGLLDTAPTTSSSAPSRPPEQNSPSAEHDLAAMAMANGEQLAASGRHHAASTSRSAAPSWPLEQYAFSAPAAFDACVALDGDDIWSIVLAKFSRRSRRIDFDVAAAPCLHPCSSKGGNSDVAPLRPNGGVVVKGGVAIDADSSAVAPSLLNGGVVINGEGAADDPMEEPKREGADTTPASDEALSPPPSPPPSPALSLSAATSLTSGSASRQPPPKMLAPGAVIARDGTGTLEQEVMDSAAVGDGLRSPTPPPPPPPAPRTTCLDPSSSKGVNSAVAPPLPNGGVVINGERAADDPMEQPKRKAADEPRSPTPPPPPAPPSTTSSFYHAAPNSSSAALWQPTEQHQASAEHDLADRLNALSAQIEQATYEQRKANDLLLERLLQSRKAREEEDAAARVERITQGLVATEFANQVMEQLTTPLLDRIQQAAPNPSPTENAAASRVPPTATLNEDDGTWNKRQITYVFHLGLAVGLLFLVRPFMPGGCEGWLLAAFAMTWGIGSIGLPAGMFGTTRLEKNCSRFTAQVVSLSFSLMVIYSAYLLVFPAECRWCPCLYFSFSFTIAIR
ncbi:hypothetical protein EJB05_02497, partial [Eragrostis curvula]